MTSPSSTPTSSPSSSPSRFRSISPVAYYWDETTKLAASDGAAGDRFGYSVSISGNTAIVGADYDNDQGPNSGSMYVMERDVLTGYWNETAKLTASDGISRASFGYSVSNSGNMVIIGAFGDGEKGDGSGSVYTFERTQIGV